MELRLNMLAVKPGDVRSGRSRLLSLTKPKPLRATDLGLPQLFLRGTNIHDANYSILLLTPTSYLCAALLDKNSALNRSRKFNREPT